jgi:hypothetical protein
MSDTIREQFPEISGFPSPWIRTSALIALLVTFTSLCGILLPVTYARETPLWAVQAIGQDYANLAVAVLLLISTYLVTHRSLRGYLVWLGSLIYLIYAFAIYAFALHFQFLFLVYVAILGLAGYTLVGGLMAVDPNMVAQILRKNRSMPYVAALLAAIGLLFGFLWLSQIIPDILAGGVPSDVLAMQLLVNPVHVLDLAFLLPGMLVTALLIRRDDPLGYLMAVPLLVFAVTMGLGIVVMMGLSTISGLPYSLPAVVMIGTIMVTGTGMTWACLRG